MATDTVSFRTVLIDRINGVVLLPDGSLADKNIISDIASFTQQYLHMYDHDRLVGILIEESKKDTSAFKVFASCIAIEYQYEKAKRKGLFGSVQGQNQYLTAQAPAAYEIYIALLRKIAELKKIAGPLL